MKNIFIGILILTVSFYLFSCAKQNSGMEEFVLIEGGEYTVGSPENEEGRRIKGEEDRKIVTVSSFYIATTETTEGEYHRVMGDSTIKSNFPMVNVSWFDAVLYCNIRSKQEGLPSAYEIEYGEDGVIKEVSLSGRLGGYRLPTENEWEIACRAGTSTAFNTGRSISRREANFNWQKVDFDESDGKYSIAGAKEVRSYRPNKWGLYEMHGNVSEWCWDWDPVRYNCGLENTKKLTKGGSWKRWEITIRSSANWGIYVPDIKNDEIGFRIVRDFLNE